MFDIGWSELAIIAVVALIVIGPKDLPKALHTVGKYVAKARKLAREFQNNVDDMVRQAELDDLRKQVEQARNFNLSQELEKTIDPKGEVNEALKLEDYASPATGTAVAGPAAPGTAQTTTAATTPASPATTPSAAVPDAEELADQDMAAPAFAPPVAAPPPVTPDAAARAEAASPPPPPAPVAGEEPKIEGARP